MEGWTEEDKAAGFQLWKIAVDEAEEFVGDDPGERIFGLLAERRLVAWNLVMGWHERMDQHLPSLHNFFDEVDFVLEWLLSPSPLKE